MDTDKGIDSVAKALQEVANIHGEAQTTTDAINVYDNWATYDENLGALNYKGAKVAAEAVVKYLSDNRDVRVLDVAAGSGLAGEELKAHGFNNIDALDASEGMLNIARQKNVYKNCIQEFFPCENPSVKTSSYDVLVNAGGISGGYMKCDCLPETVRCLKTGGHAVFSFSEKNLTTVAEYKDRLEPLMKQLEMEGQWTMLERSVIPNFYHTYNGLLFVFKVTKAEN